MNTQPTFTLDTPKSKVSLADIREILIYSIGLVTGATAALIFNLMIN